MVQPHLEVSRLDLLEREIKAGTKTLQICKQHMVLLFCTQIAGAAAAAGLSLKEVAAVANDTAKECRSVGVATHICTLPGAAPSDRSAVQASPQPSVIVLRPVLLTEIVSDIEG